MIYVNALERGGWSAYGGAHFDTRDRVVRLDVFEDEVLDVTITFPWAVSSVDYEEDGIDGSEPSISSAVVTLQFQELNPSGLYKLLATSATGATKLVQFQANPSQPITTGSITVTDDDDVDYGAHG